MTAQPPSDWLDQGQNAVWFFGVAFMGFMVFLFGKPIQHTKPSKRNQGRKRASKENLQVQTPKKAVIRKSRTTQKRKKQKPKPRYTAPPLSPQQQAIYSGYKAKWHGGKGNSWNVAGMPL